MLLESLLALLTGAVPALPRAPTATVQDGEASPGFTFSEGPFERAWALVDARSPLAPLEAARLPPVDPAASEAPQAWQAWASAVRRAAGSDEAADARLWLAAFARTQERHDDAWDHLAHAGDDPQGLRAVLPLLVPGVSAADLERWPALPDGVLLAPALPPPDRAAAEIVLGTGRLRRGTLRVEGFGVGAATLALTLSVEGDGVQVDLEHLAGGPARLRVRLPEPPDFELRSEYLDWSRLEGTREAREIVLEPGGETRTLFGRYQPRRVEWPAQVPPGIPAQAALDGLRLLSRPGDPQVGLAHGLGLLLGLEVEALELPPGALPDAFAGLQVDLREPRSLAAKRAGLVSLAERFALSRPR